MFRNILVPVDLSDEATSRKPMERAIELARQSGGQLHVMYVVPSFSTALVGSYFPPDYETKMLADAEAGLERFLSEHVPADISANPLVVVGTIYEEVIRAARELDCDLVVMGRSSSGKASFLLGPNSARVVRHARTSVLVASD